MEGQALQHIPLVEGEEKAERVKLNNNQIYRIENLVSLPVISFLDVSNNLIHLINNLEGLASLRELRLDNNFIENLEQLSSLKRLEKLSVRNNKLKNLRDLNQLQWLTDLDISSNVLEHFNVGGLCPSLEILDISLNKMRSLESISNNTLKLKTLSVQQNPLDRDSNGKLVLKGFRELQNLRIDAYLERVLEGIEEDCRINDKLILKRTNSIEKQKVNPQSILFKELGQSRTGLQINQNLDTNLILNNNNRSQPLEDDEEMVTIGVPITPMHSLKPIEIPPVGNDKIKEDEDYKMIEQALSVNLKQIDPPKNELIEPPKGK